MKLFLSLLVLIAVVSPHAASARVLEFGMATPRDSVGTTGRPGRDVGLEAVPDINGPGHVSTTGNVWIKTTNVGLCGNPYQAQSSDPCAQWPGPSGNEFLYYFGLWVGARNPEALDPAQVHRVSAAIEWRPPTLAPEDHIYQAYDGQIFGQREVDDDRDGRVDEEFLNGKDDDHDGSIDEDFAAISQQMFTCEIRDDTEQAVNSNSSEKHVPFGLLTRQTTYAFSVPGTNDFTAFDYDIENQSGHMLDSVYVGFFIDQDVGPASLDRYFADDLPDPRVPQGDYPQVLTSLDPNYDPARCTVDTVHVRGFTMTDDDGDLGRTVGASSFLLLNCTIDPTGVKGPRRVGFRVYRVYSAAGAFTQGGPPTVDLEGYQAMAFGLSGAQVPAGVDPVTGFINEERPDFASKADYFSLCSIGPYLQWQNGEHIDVAVALAVQRIDYTKPLNDPDGSAGAARYAAIIGNAIAAQKTYRGQYVNPQANAPRSDAPGRETALIAPPGQQYDLADCRDAESGQARTVKDDDYTWFDLDCDFCTGVEGTVLRHWLASAPPPNPALRLTPGDRSVTLEWDNLSEVTPDPASGFLDFKGYRIWKASNFTRPVGSSGPGDELWSLLAELRSFDYLRPLRDSIDTNSDGRRDSLVLTYPVLLNTQSNERIHPIDIAPCKVGTTSLGGDCPRASTAPGDTAYFSGRRLIDIRPGVATLVDYKTPIYPVGRYRYVDPNVLNGFVYFYSVTAKDSTGHRDVTGSLGTLAEQEGRRSAVEADGVVPQAEAASSATAVYVVPNPFRGHAQWDLSPNATDPTGTHIDFFNMPKDDWVLRIFTLAGDLVQTIRPSDTLVDGKPQRETPSDGQATWNLISRNGQDVVSGIYLFSVESNSETMRGRFVIIR